MCSKAYVARWEKNSCQSKLLPLSTFNSKLMFTLNLIYCCWLLKYSWAFSFSSISILKWKCIFLLANYIRARSNGQRVCACCRITSISRMHESEWIIMTGKSASEMGEHQFSSGISTTCHRSVGSTWCCTINCAETEYWSEIVGTVIEKNLFHCDQKVTSPWIHANLPKKKKNRFCIRL